MIVEVGALVRDQIFKKFRANQPASAAQIEQCEAAIGFELPASYQNFLKRQNGGEGFIGPNAYVIFWRVTDLMEMNKAYQVGEYAPGLFIFGSDGGGEAYAFDIRNNEMLIVSVPFVGMGVSLARVVASNFDDFLDTLSGIGSPHADRD